MDHGSEQKPSLRRSVKGEEEEKGNGGAVVHIVIIGPRRSNVCGVSPKTL